MLHGSSVKRKHGMVVRHYQPRKIHAFPSISGPALFAVTKLFSRRMLHVSNRSGRGAWDHRNTHALAQSARTKSWVAKTKRVMRTSGMLGDLNTGTTDVRSWAEKFREMRWAAVLP